MEVVERTGAGVKLAIELGTGTAIIDGERIELPPKEFALLAALAARPGEAIPTSDLMVAVWPEENWMTPQDLYWYVNRLRKRIGDDKRENKIVANRRRFGYLLDLPPSTVQVSQTPIESTPEVIVLEEPEDQPIPLTEIEETPVPTATPSERRRHPALVLVALLCTVVLVPVLATRASRSPASTHDEKTQAQLTDDGAPTRSPQFKRTQPAPRPNKPRHRRSNTATAPGTRSDSSVVIAADDGDQTQEPARQQSAKAPAAPPAPTRYLYDLVNSESADHFVTIDPSLVSEYQARGYVATEIGLVYSEKVAGTKEITTNSGPAYVFIEADTSTSPKVRTAALWLLSDGHGDFFYSTDDSTPQGWHAVRVGYVGRA
jgi:DNA-binding winged helix-turn-helix (wHTH) protein